MTSAPALRDRTVPRGETLRRELTLPVPNGAIVGDLVLPPRARGVVIFAHGSGSGRGSPRNRRVAKGLEDAGLGTLLLDLLTVEEAELDAVSGRFRFDIPRLAERLTAAVDALATRPETTGRPAGLYGASTGGAAALLAAADRPEAVRAVVLRGARSDLAGPGTRRVRAPTLFLVGELDPEVHAMNLASLAEVGGPKRLVVVRGAGHLFEEPGALEEVAHQTRDWFLKYFPPLPPVEGRT
jgi:putative phosphoribosyl transferase